MEKAIAKRVRIVGVAETDAASGMKGQRWRDPPANNVLGSV